MVKLDIPKTNDSREPYTIIYTYINYDGCTLWGVEVSAGGWGLAKYSQYCETFASSWFGSVQEYPFPLGSVEYPAKKCAAKPYH